MNARQLEEQVFKGIMLLSLGIVFGSLVVIIGTVVIKGIDAISLEMVTQVSAGGAYLGKGGILHAIMGSFYLVLGATAVALPPSIGMAFFLQTDFTQRRISALFRTVLDILWGVPSIVYGICMYVVMIQIGMGISLMGGILALALVELPIMTRGMDEALRSVPLNLKENSYALGAKKIETVWRVVRRQAIPGILSAILLAVGRGIGDAASVLYTSGYSDYMPTSLVSGPVASLPTTIYFLSTSPIETARNKAYAAAFILIIIVLLASMLARCIGKKYSRMVVK
jgi:phosphate transport system permease protein